MFPCGKGSIKISNGVSIMKKEEVFDKVKAEIIEHTGVHRDHVVEGAKLVDDLGLDSLDLVEMVMMIEGEFDLEIPDATAEAFETVGNVVDYVTGIVN